MNKNVYDNNDNSNKDAISCCREAARSRGRSTAPAASPAAAKTAASLRREPRRLRDTIILYGSCTCLCILSLCYSVHIKA